MIEATRIETPEVERPDLYVRVLFYQGSKGRSVPTSAAWPEPLADRMDGAEEFLLPGTRREKRTKAYWDAMDEMPRPSVQGDMAEYGIRMLAWSRQVDAARSALLALAAEGVKP